MRWKLLIVLFMINVSLALAADPTIFFSDLTDGVISGGHWGGAQEGKGAAVSIWGTNFGSTRGSSIVEVCGTVLEEDSDFTEWGVVDSTANVDTGYNSARGMERITFWLNSDMIVGQGGIKVTTANGDSEEIPFYCRDTGNIYFVSTSGDNSNDGLTLNTTWLEPKKARESLQAGDVAYFRAGSYGTEDNWDANIDFLSNNHNNGEENNSIALASYPGEFAALTTQNENIRHHGSGGDILNYWTFSKFIMRPINHITNWGLLDVGSDENIRFIGNDMSTYPSYKPTILPISGRDGGSSWMYILGNYIHDAWVHDRGDNLTGDTHSYGLYIEGYGHHTHYRIGYNEIAWIPDGKGIQVYGHNVNDFVDDIHIFNNYIHHTSQNGMVIGGGDGEGGSYDYQFMGSAYIYNNIVYKYNFGNTVEGREGIQFGQSNWDQIGGDYYLYNNVIGQGDNGGDCLMPQGNPDSVTMRNNIFFSNNSFYDGDFDGGTVIYVGKNLYFGGASDIVAWESDYLISDPTFVDLENGDFRLQDGSPAIDNGTSNVSSIVNLDYSGVSRPQGSGYDIGAYEKIILSQNYHDADTNEDGVISTTELRTYVLLWRSGSVSLQEITGAINNWKQ